MSANRPQWPCSGETPEGGAPLTAAQMAEVLCHQFFRWLDTLDDRTNRLEYLVLESVFLNAVGSRRKAEALQLEMARMQVHGRATVQAVAEGWLKQMEETTCPGQ